METQKIESVEEVFEQIVKIRPAYDNRHKGQGIGGCNMFMALKGTKGCVILLVSTGWFLPCTMEWKEICVERGGISSWEARGMAVSYCSPVKLEEWQEPRENCDWLGCTCYGDTGYTMADEPFGLLLTKGSDAVFEWLKNYYYSVFTPKQTEQT